MLLGGGLRVRPTRERGDGLRRWTRGIPGHPAGPRARAGREPPGAGLHRRPREAVCADPTRRACGARCGLRGRHGRRRQAVPQRPGRGDAVRRGADG